MTATGFWTALTAAEREAYALIAEERTFPPGTVLCAEGTHHAQVIVVTSGWVKVCGQERVVAVRGAGDVIGGDSAPARHTITALGEVAGLVMPASRFAELVAEHPPIRAALSGAEVAVPSARDVESFSAHPVPAWSSLNCSIFYTDVAGFSAPSRTEADRQVVRDRLYEILRGAFEDSGVSWNACYHEDRGDGALVIVPPEIPTRAVADPLLALLAAALRRHNRQAGVPVRIQLRAALHLGPVTRDAEGLGGDAIIHTARMLDAPPLRAALRSAEADLAFMASGHVFDTVLRSDRGLVDPRLFTPVNFQVKESQIAAWMYVAGARATAAPPSPAEPAPGHDGVHFHETVRVTGDLVLGNKIISSEG